MVIFHIVVVYEEHNTHFHHYIIVLLAGDGLSRHICSRHVFMYRIWITKVYSASGVCVLNNKNQLTEAPIFRNTPHTHTHKIQP